MEKIVQPAISDGLSPICQSSDECQLCELSITGPVAGPSRVLYHPECFLCKSCGLVIGELEPYVLINHRDLYCDPCFKLNITKIKETKHSIRLVELPHNENCDKRLDRGETKIKLNSHLDQNIRIKK